MIRLPGVCNHNPESTVLAHARFKNTGMGLKEPDLFGAFSCSSCHDVIDGRRKYIELSREHVQLMFAMGVFRTQKYWLEKGLIKV